MARKTKTPTKHTVKHQAKPKAKTEQPTSHPDGYSLLLDELRKAFPDAVTITPGEALVWSGLTKARDPDAAARQQLSNDSYPFPVCTVGKRNRILLTDIAETLARSRHRGGAS